MKISGFKNEKYEKITYGKSMPGCNMKGIFEKKENIERFKRIKTKAFLTDYDRRYAKKIEGRLNEAIYRIIDTRKPMNAKLRRDIFAIRRDVTHLLSRQILYIGSECNRLGKIEISKEYKSIKRIITHTKLNITKVRNPNFDEIISTWDDIKPKIVVISCHGDSMGLFLENDEGKCQHYPNTDFIPFFEKRSNYTECVILSSCESLTLGTAIKNSGKKVVCINTTIDIKAAQEFLKAFFKYLNKNASDDSYVYKQAFNHSIEIVDIKAPKGSFAFEFLETNKYD
jgi:hypothetical protein